MPTSLLEELRAALKTAHDTLLEPPQHVKEDPDKLKGWWPLVRTQVDWEAIGNKDYHSELVVPPTDNAKPQDDGNEAPLVDEADEDAPSKDYLENRYLTIGLIGASD